MALPLTKIEKYLKENTDMESLVSVEVVERYIELLRMYRRMHKEIQKDGVRTVVINGSQEYIKAHPLITEMRNINAQLVNLKRDIDKHIEEYKMQMKKDAAEYDASDLM